MRKRTCKQKTLASLESRFLDRGTSKINEAYLNEQIMLMLDNERDLYNAIHHTRQRPESLAWSAFLRLAQEIVGDDWRDEFEWTVTSEQLKAFLLTYGQSYSSIRESVCYIQSERTVT